MISFPMDILMDIYYHLKQILKDSNEVDEEKMEFSEIEEMENENESSMGEY